MTKLVFGTPEYDRAVEEFQIQSKMFQDDINRAFSNLDKLCRDFWDQLEEPEEYYQWPYVNGKTFGMGYYESDPYWVSSSEQC